MNTETTTVDEQVAALLAAHSITFNVTSTGPRVKRDSGKPWECDSWLCRFAKEGRQEEFEYFTGTGHRKQVRHTQYTRGTVAYANWLRANPDAFRAVAPDAASVLHSLIMDLSAASQSFESWAADCGYDTDSRKAEGIYRACQQNADKLARVIPADVRAELAELLQDY